MHKKYAGLWAACGKQAIKGFERPGCDARGLEIRVGDGEVIWDRGWIGVPEEKGWEEGESTREDKGRLE